MAESSCWSGWRYEQSAVQVVDGDSASALSARSPWSVRSGTCSVGNRLCLPGCCPIWQLPEQWLNACWFSGSLGSGVHPVVLARSRDVYQGVRRLFHTVLRRLCCPALLISP